MFENPIYLRKVDFCDLSLLLEWENNPINQQFGDHKTIYTEEEMINFIAEQTEKQDLNQIRWVICLLKNHQAVGLIDLFQIHQISKSAYVGILIANEQHRKMGYATHAVKLLQNKAKHELGLTQLKCNIQTSNFKSIHLFKKCGFEQIEVHGEIEKYACSLDTV